YVEVWWSAIGSFTELLESLAPDQWSLPTDLPGWDVHAVAAHIAHLASVLSGAGEETAEVGSPAHAQVLIGQYTEIGVFNRRATPPGELVAQIRDRAGRRYQALRDDRPTDANAPAPITPGGLPWSWERLLRNRVLDVWMHEQ